MSEIADPVREAARVRPDAPAVVGPDGMWTYASLDGRVTLLAARLRAEGLTRGDRLAIFRPPDADYLALLLAAFRLGIVVAPLNVRQPAAMVPELLEQIGCRVLVAGPDEAWEDLRVLDLAVHRDALGADESTSWYLDAPATLVFTSGSTGTPKAALHTLGNHVWSARGSVEFFGLGPGDRWLLDLPLYHVGGLAILFRCVLAGAAVVLPNRLSSVPETIAAHSVTHASFVTTQLLRLLRDGHADALAGVKAILLGGSAMPPGLIAEAHRLGLPISTSYGMTEMSSTVTATPPDAGLDALGTAGVVLPHREVRLADDGEVLVRGATLFAGYAEGDTVERPDRDGWFPTGDLGVWAEVGGRRMLRVVGRKDNLFISGGENVQPEEIEAALGRLDGVRRAVVVPVPDTEFGQRPVAFVESDAWQPGVWSEALSASLARFKIPIAFYAWPESIQHGIKVSRARFQAHADTLPREERG